MPGDAEPSGNSADADSASIRRAMSLMAESTSRSPTSIQTALLGLPGRHRAVARWLMLICWRRSPMSSQMRLRGHGRAIGGSSFVGARQR